MRRLLHPRAHSGLAAVVAVCLLPLVLVALPQSTRAAGVAVARELRTRLTAATRLGVPLDRVTVQALDPAETHALVLALGGRERVVRLAPSGLRARGFRVLVDHGDGALFAVTPPPPATYRGTLDDTPGARAVFARVAGAWHGVVTLPRADGGREAWTITPLSALDPAAPAALVAIARRTDLPAAGGTCAVDGSAPAVRAEPSPEALARVQALWPESMRAIQLACDADSEFYALDGSSVDATVADIEAVLAGASSIYEFDLQATIQVGTILVRTVQAPYTSTAPSTLLAQEASEWSANQSGVVRDAVQLFTGKVLSGTTIGNSYQGTMCSRSQGYSLVRSRFSSVLANRIENSAHELAHNFGIAHCDYNDFDCRIMCSSIGYCSGGIHSFGPWEETTLRAEIATFACLDTVTVSTNHAALPFNDTFTGVDLDASRWTGADRYSVAGSRLQLDDVRGYGTTIDLGTARTLPIVMTGDPTLAYKLMSSLVPAGQQLVVDYFNTQARKWLTLDLVTAPIATWTPYTHTLGDTALGDLFALRFTAYGSGYAAGAQWYIDDVAITASAGVPPDAPPHARPLTASPSPFVSATRVAFALPAAARVRLAVFDVRGALVRTLLDEPRGAGPGAVTWDGCAADGRAVAPGVYVVRLDAPGSRQALQIVRLR